MDAIAADLLTTTVVPLASGAAGAAGKQAWASLVAFIRGRFGGDAAPMAEALEQHPDRARAEEFADRLVHLAGQDREFDGWLRRWLHDAAPLTHQKVVNVVSGTAHVSGGLVQAHTINGSLTFGVVPAPPPPPSPPPSADPDGR